MLNQSPAGASNFAVIRPDNVPPSRGWKISKFRFTACGGYRGAYSVARYSVSILVACAGALCAVELKSPNRR
jgi:hypothetical protein